MTRKEKVLAYIKSPEYLPLKADEIMAVLCVGENDKAEFLSILDELISERKIQKSKKGRFSALLDTETIEGVLSCSQNGFFAFLIPDSSDEDDIFIHGDNLFGALHNDRVLASIEKTSLGKRKEGRVLKIIKHNNTHIVGIVKRKKRGLYEIRPDSPRIYSNILVREENLLGAELNSRVIVEITSYSPDLTGIVSKVLGDSNDLKSNIDSICFEQNIDDSFSPKTLEEIELIPDCVSEEEIVGRCDLRDKLIFTIDGEDARDFDDAVSLDMLPDGNFRLGVHIADVTHYVKENSSLDYDAFSKGTSTYFPDRVIPMLPKKLSNGICSLNPDCDRLTLSAFMNISRNGEVSDFELVKSVIHSKERMTYDNVNLLLDNPPKELLKKYSHLLDTLVKMKELSSILRNRRMARGSIDFDFPEAKILTNDNGEPVDIIRVGRGISHKMIEEFMLLANENVAEYAFWSEIPFIFRIHEPPSYEKTQDLQHFLQSFGLGIKGTFSPTEPIFPKALQQVIEKAEGREEEHMILVYALRSLMKAEYHPENLGHFGLSSKYYCHFTSPIRRYPDLFIHRVLKSLLNGEDLSKYVMLSKKASNQSSEKEKNSQIAQRDVDDLMKTYYMSSYIGYVFDARISSITDFGMFAELENTVEGLIRLENLKDDYYVFDSEKRILVGSHSGREYKIGDNISIAVARCDILTRQIDFILSEDASMVDIDNLQKREFRKRREKEKKITSKSHSQKAFKKARRPH